jgi:hypothetical protein
MRTAIQEASKEKMSEQKKILSERSIKGDALFEKWSKKKNLGEGMDKIYDSNPDAGRGLAFILENQQNYLKSLTETQISSAFSTTPENALRVVRLGYPNSVRGEIFLEWPMETARDSIYYLSPIYDTSKRGSTISNVTHESSSYRYASEVEEESLGTGDGSTATFTGGDSGKVVNPPLRPFTVKVFVDNTPVAADDGAGNLVGDAVDSGSVTYTTGEFSITFASGSEPDAGEDVLVQYWYDSEDSDQYEDIGSVELQLKDYQFRAKPYPLTVSWSKMTELLLGTTLSIDAEEALITGAGDELKKALDFQALRMAYRYSRKNSLQTFNASFAAAGADSEMAHAQSITRTIADAGDVIFSALQRGGVTKMAAGPQAANYLMLHNRFSSAGAQPKVGAHKVGSLDDMDLYKAPSDIIPTDEIMCVWRNDNEPNDVSLACGTLIPLYRTQTLEYAQAYKETGLYSFGDLKMLQSKYIVRIRLTNL